MEVNTGLWKKTSKSGTIYYSGKCEVDGRPHRITLFSNSTKMSEKSPDMKLKIEATDERPVENTYQNEEQSTQAIQSLKQEEIIINDEDLPF